MSRTESLHAPAILVERATLRVLGTQVTLLEPLRQAAEADLGLKLDFVLRDGTEAQRVGTLEPESFDVYDQWFHDIDLIWPASSLQGVDVNRITAWNTLREMPHLSADPGEVMRRGPNLGSAPSQRLYVQYNGELSASPTDCISLLPTVHNADSFAALNFGDDPLPSSWAQLLDVGTAPHIALQNDAAIGALDAILALTAADELHCADPGNLDLSEINRLIEIVGQRMTRNGRGRRVHFWRNGKSLVAQAAKGHRIVTSMWWSVFLTLRAKGIDARMVTPKEGYRGWYGGMGLSRNLSGKALDAAYEYLNWWHGGFAGSLMTRNGAYMGNLEAVKAHLSSAELAFWYDGTPASEPICDAFGTEIFAVGERREGGAYHDRMAKIAVWNTVMDEHNYLVRRWDSLKL